MMQRIAMLALAFLLPVGTVACMQGDSEEAILADCSQVNLAPTAVDQCLERARVANETNPSPRLDALIADLKAGAIANAAPPPPDDNTVADQAPPDDDLDATAPLPDASDSDAPPADEDMSGPDDNDNGSDNPDAGPPDDNTDQLSPSEDEPAQDDDSSPPPPPPATDSGPQPGLQTFGVAT